MSRIESRMAWRLENASKCAFPVISPAGTRGMSDPCRGRDCVMQTSRQGLRMRAVCTLLQVWRVGILILSSLRVGCSGGNDSTTVLPKSDLFACNLLPSSISRRSGPRVRNKFRSKRLTMRLGLSCTSSMCYDRWRRWDLRSGIT